MKTQAGAILSAINIDRQGDRTISVQLYMGLRDIILGGGLKVGERLPASRTLCHDLGVSRTTVVDALERLISEGLLEARVGSGTFVSTALRGYPPRTVLPEASASPPPEQPHQVSNTISSVTNRFAARNELPNNPGSFVTGLPALDKFPMAHWARLSAKHWRTPRPSVMGYSDPAGLPALRSAIATHLKASRGINCNPENVLVTGGAQQAFSLIANVLLNPDDGVWFENPGAIGARNALLSSGARLIPVGVDTHGIKVAEGLRKASDFRLAFVTPSNQQPSGAVMSLTRKLELLQAARVANAYIVEDDYDGEFHFGQKLLPTLKSIDSQDRVLYVGTFSKSLFPSLRLGYVLAPDGLVDVFHRVAATTLYGAPSSTQSITANFMDEGLFATHVRQMRKVYRERHDALLQHSARLPGWISVKPSSGGFHAVGQIDPDLDEHRLVSCAAERGIVLAPLSRYCLESVATRGVVLGYGSVTEAEIRNGIQALASLKVYSTELV